MGDQKAVLSGSVSGIIIDDVVHILKPSSSRFALRLGDVLNSYCCQDGCCDAGLQPDVDEVVSAAKMLGATKVIIRMGQRGYRLGGIAGLPVEDVSDHVGELNGFAAVVCRR
jgi:hypothetical protein